MKTHLKQKPKQGLLLLENDDGKGNIIEEETEATQTYLYITVSCKTVDEMIREYNFDARQQMLLRELLKEEDNSLCSAVLYEIGQQMGKL